MKKSLNYTVYFEIYGKKMKVIVLAESEQDAIRKVNDKLIVHKVSVDKSDTFNQCMDTLDNIMDHLNIKP